MASTQDWRCLLEELHSIEDTWVALRRLVEASLDLSGADHAMLALVDDDAGVLRLTHGVGPEWSDRLIGLELDVESPNEGIVTLVARTGRAHLARDVKRDRSYLRLFPSTASEYALPLVDQFGRVRGVLNLESQHPGAFHDASREAAKLLALLAVRTLERQDLARREEALVQIGSALDAAQSEEELVQKVLAVADSLLQMHSFSVFLREPGSEVLRLRGSIGGLKDLIGVASYRCGEGLTGFVAETGQPVLLDHPQDHPNWKGLHLEMPPSEVASYLAVPVLNKGNCQGVLRAIRRRSDNPLLQIRFTTHDLRVVQTIAEQLAAGLENLRNWTRVVQAERMAAWGELSAKSSHMIGNRVFALRGDVNELRHLLSTPSPSVDSLLDVADGLQRNVERIEEILQDFRDFLTATTLQKAPASVAALVRETVDEVVPPSSRVRVEVAVPEPLPDVLLDERKVRRALSELIENALNHMPSGELRIEASLDHTPTGRRTLKIVVADTGPGVPTELKRAIFEPFRSTRVKGMGLGLSIVQGIVEAHGGQVFEDGVPGRGARFVMMLPVAAVHNGESHGDS
ncbi:MAG: GAF domain-containing protein [Fimbriimonadales bacterium]|nr:GAF domain-containing protein [Fimbriimonadales bacterium]